MNKLIQRTFENRGYTEQFIRDINNPSYDLLKDIDVISAKLHEIYDSHAVITIYPDFDVDGISSGNIWFAGLAELGFCVNLFVPDTKQGYGLSVNEVDSIMKSYPDTNVIITCDNGISAYAAADYCKQAGIELIITDHHKQKIVANADIIIDPMRIDETYSHPAICGAFVSYQIIQHYADLYCTSYMQSQISRLRVFAGIGTISDTMPLLYENRQIVKDAIAITRMLYCDGKSDVVDSIPGCAAYHKAFVGLYQAAKVCEKHGIISSSEDITEDFFGFYFAPMFNSVKRLDGDMNKAFGVFFTDDGLSDMEYLFQLNIERKSLVANELKKISNVDQPYAPYIYLSTASSGILGLIAMKLCMANGCPTFVLNDDGENAVGNRYHGSGRSPEWYPCIKRLSNSMSIDGHEFAFGCGLENKTHLDRFYAFLIQDVAYIKANTPTVEIIPDFIIATDWSADTGIDVDLFADYLKELNTLRPFGKNFPKPYVKFVFFNKDVTAWQIIGKSKQHLKIRFSNGFDVLCWNQADMINQKNVDMPHCIFGQLGTSEYQGETSINFVGDFIE